MSAAINVFLRQAIACKGLPFDVTRKVPNAATRDAVEAVDHGNFYDSLDSISELMEALNDMYPQYWMSSIGVHIKGLAEYNGCQTAGFVL